jgi:hypothetical protein
LAAAGVSFAIKDARGVGHTDDRTETLFEVACRDGSGYILHTVFPVSASKLVRVEPCLAVALADAGLACALTDAATINVSFNDLVRQSGKTCQVKDRQLIGFGFMIGYALPTMTLSKAVTCELAGSRLGDSCVLPGDAKRS